MTSSGFKGYSNTQCPYLFTVVKMNFKFILDETTVVVFAATSHSFDARPTTWLSQLKPNVKVGQSL